MKVFFLFFVGSHHIVPVSVNKNAENEVHETQAEERERADGEETEREIEKGTDITSIPFYTLFVRCAQSSEHTQTVHDDVSQSQRMIHL